MRWLAILALTLTPLAAAEVVVVVQPPAAGASVLKQTTGAALSSFNIGNDAAHELSGGSFTASSSFTLTRADFTMAKVLSATQTLTCHVYSATGTPGTPNALLATSTNTVAASSIAAAPSASTVTFNFSGQALVSGTRYFLIFSIGDGTADAANYVVCARDTTGGAQLIESSDTSPVSWTTDFDATIFSELWGF